METVGSVSDSTLIILGIIATIPTIVVALINRRAIKETRESHEETSKKVDDNTQTTKAILHQVKNDHGTNLRDDLDEFKRSVAETLEKIEAAQGYLGGTVGTLLKDVHTTLRSQRAHDAASSLIVDELRKRDNDLQAEIRFHHPEEGSEKP